MESSQATLYSICQQVTGQQLGQNKNNVLYEAPDAGLMIWVGLRNSLGKQIIHS